VALYEDSAAVNIVLCGDFNCQPGSRFYRLYADHILDLYLVECDVNRLFNGFTYCNDSGTATSWIDHIMCSNRIDQLVENVDSLYHYITSDHKPLFLSLHNVGACENPTVSPVSVGQNVSVAEFVTDWKRCDDAVLYQYSCMLDDSLRKN